MQAIDADREKYANEVGQLLDQLRKDLLVGPEPDDADALWSTTKRRLIDELPALLVVSITPVPSPQIKPNFTLWHVYGPTPRAVFGDAGTARDCEFGLTQHGAAGFFYFTDDQRRIVTFDVNSRGHAFAIVKSLSRPEA